MNPSVHSPRIRGHRKRISRLSSDTTNTTNTLPEYTSPGWKRSDLDESLRDPESDKPPDYPDSAEEADADTEDFDSDHDVYANSLSSPSTSPRRVSSRLKNNARRQQTTASNDDVLDSLLERSVHALEMSNVLLQSTMSTQTR
jgi:hypothetical protein